MNSSVLLLSGPLFSLGIYWALCELLHIPTMQATKVAMKISQGKKVRWYQAAMIGMTEGLARYIHLNDYRRQEMAKTLEYADMNQSPETFLASLFVKTGLKLLLVIPCSLITPLLIPFVLLYVFNKASENIKEPQKIVAKKRESIDNEMPGFTATIAQELKASRDVLTILEKYRPSAGEVFARQLDITIAGMRSGSQEQALMRLASRVGSSMLNEVVRGLLGTLRGDNEEVYFELKSDDYKKSEKKKLQKIAQQRPPKIKKFCYLLLVCIMATYLYATFKQMTGGLGGLF